MGVIAEETARETYQPYVSDPLYVQTLILEDGRCFVITKVKTASGAVQHEVDLDKPATPYGGRTFLVSLKTPMQTLALGEDATSWLMDRAGLRLQVGSLLIEPDGVYTRARVEEYPSASTSQKMVLKDRVTGFKTGVDFKCQKCKRTRVEAITALGVRCACGHVTP